MRPLGLGKWGTFFTARTLDGPQFKAASLRYCAGHAGELASEAAIYMDIQSRSESFIFNTVFFFYEMMKGKRGCPNFRPQQEFSSGTIKCREIGAYVCKMSIQLRPPPSLLLCTCVLVGMCVRWETEELTVMIYS